MTAKLAPAPLLQECACTVDSAVQQWKKSHAAEVEALVRTTVENNEQHEVEIASCSAEEHASNSSKDITEDIDGPLKEARKSSSRVMSTVEAHIAELQQLQDNHSNQAVGM